MLNGLLTMNKWLIRILLVMLSVSPACGQTTQQLRDSLSTLIRQIEQNKNSVDLRLQKAALNMQLQQWEYAKDEYSEVLRMDKGNLTALRFRGYAHERMGNYNFARADYETFLKEVPDHFETLLGLALLNQKDKHFTEAMDQINRVVEMFPDNAVAYAARAGIELERGLNELAEYDFSEAIRFDEENADYWLDRAEVRISLGRKKEALADIHQAMSLGVARADVEHLLKRCRK